MFWHQYIQALKSPPLINNPNTFNEDIDISKFVCEELDKFDSDLGKYKVAVAPTQIKDESEVGAGVVVAITGEGADNSFVLDLGSVNVVEEAPKVEYEYKQETDAQNTFNYVTKATDAYAMGSGNSFTYHKATEGGDKLFTLAGVTAGVAPDADGKVTADYVRGDELISAIRTDGSDKKGSTESYYIYDGHVSTRLS